MTKVDATETDDVGAKGDAELSTAVLDSIDISATVDLLRRKRVKNSSTKCLTFSRTVVFVESQYKGQQGNFENTTLDNQATWTARAYAERTAKKL